MSAKKIKQAPTLSLCIPSYNRADDIIQVLKDLQKQTVAPYEIVINDDCSDERDVKKIKAFLKTMPSVKWYANKKNKRLAGNCNEAVKRAKGEYVALVNNDDRVSPRYVEEIMAAIQTYPGFNAYMTNAIGITEEKALAGDYRLYRSDSVIAKKTGIRHLFAYSFFNLISISGAAFYKTAYIQKVLFDETRGNEADLDFAMKMLATIDIMYVDKAIYFVRMHSESTSRMIRMEESKLLDNIQRCITIYSSYPSHKKNVPLYTQRIKGMYILQLLVKYRFSLKRTKDVLDIPSYTQFILCATTIPWLILTYYLRRFTALARKKKYLSSAPADIQNLDRSILQHF